MDVVNPTAYITSICQKCHACSTALIVDLQVSFAAVRGRLLSCNHTDMLDVKPLSASWLYSYSKCLSGLRRSQGGLQGVYILVMVYTWINNKKKRNQKRIYRKKRHWEGGDQTVT